MATVLTQYSLWGKEAKLVFLGHTLMENRHGLVIDFEVTTATGTAGTGSGRPPGG